MRSNRRNPFTPNFGVMPPYLAGRESAQDKIVAGSFAAPAAIFAGVAVAASGVASLVFATFSVATSILGSHATSEVSEESKS